MKFARKRYGTMRQFAEDLRVAIGWSTLSMAAVYAWESGATRVPAVALVAAAELAGLPLDALLETADRSADAHHDLNSARANALADQVGRLEDRIKVLERRLPS